jgi:6-phospho-beta-glucosidase
VVEVPGAVDASGPWLPTAPLAAHAAGLVAGVEVAERATIDAATPGSPRAALRAIGHHPLVDSVNVAGRLLDRYVRELPDLAHLSDA